jgi:hypothetical protein
MRIRACCLAIGAAAALGFALAAQAHHSQAMYDLKTWKTLEGTVKQMRWTFPHTWLYIEVKDAKGESQVWGLEAANPNAVQEAGVKKEDLRPGDRVSARCHPQLSGLSACVLGFVTPRHGDKARGDGVERAWN